jgi:inhibitor of KinA
VANISFQPLGDSGIRMAFHEKVSPELNRTIRAFCRELEKKHIPGITEWVPTYNAVTVYYLPTGIGYEELQEGLSELAEGASEVKEELSERIFIPTLYGGEAGEDLTKVADINGLTEQEVIDIHSGTDYLIYMIGFLPGFPYLGGMSEKIATPRLDTPRSRVPAGAVGIAGEQTGIYPLESPGGWNLIGRTPVKLFNPVREQPFLFRAGDSIRFCPISQKEYAQINKDVENGRYEVKREAISS